MTTALRKLITRLRNMPPSEQNAIAELLSEELGWQQSYKLSQDKLSWLAEEALTEYKKKKIKRLNLK